LAAVTGVALWLAALIHVDYGDNWSALFCIGEHAPMPPELAPGSYRWKGTNGYDGQYYRYVAHDRCSAKATRNLSMRHGGVTAAS